MDVADQMTDEREFDKKVTGGSGINAGGNVTFGNVSGQFVIGRNVMQTQSIMQADLIELRKNLLDFQKGVEKLDISSDDQSIVNGKISEAIKEAKKDTPAIPTIKERFENTISTIKKTGKSLKDISELYEPAKKIAKMVGIGLSLLL